MLWIFKFSLETFNTEQTVWSYSKGSGDFIKKIRNLGWVPENAILVTADVVGLYPKYHVREY